MKCVCCQKNLSNNDIELGLNYCGCEDCGNCGKPFCVYYCLDDDLISINNSVNEQPEEEENINNE